MRKTRVPWVLCGRRMWSNVCRNKWRHPRDCAAWWLPIGRQRRCEKRRWVEGMCRRWRRRPWCVPTTASRCPRQPQPRRSPGDSWVSDRSESLLRMSSVKCAEQFSHVTRRSFFILCTLASTERAISEERARSQSQSVILLLCVLQKYSRDSRECHPFHLPFSEADQSDRALLCASWACPVALERWAPMPTRNAPSENNCMMLVCFLFVFCKKNYYHSHSQLNAPSRQIDLKISSINFQYM